MKLTQAKSKIAGIQLGEASLNIIRPHEPPLKAKFALISLDDAVCGYMDKASGWSEKVLEALKTFTEALEEDVMKHLFEVSESAESSQSNPEVAEPPQF